MPVEKQGDIPWYEWPLRWLGAFVNAVIPSITAYAPGPEDPEVQKYHAKKRLELKPGDKVPDSEDETRKIVKEKFKNDSKKWIESIPRNVKLPELPKEPDWNSIGWDKLKGTDPETTILRRWILSKFIDYKKSKYYNPKALSPETLKQIELLETKELDRIAHELYKNLHPATATVDWAMLGRVVLMVGGATVAVLVSGGTLAPVAGAAIMGGAGLVVGGGTELANQVQSGGEINATAVLNRAIGEGAKSTLFQIPGASLLGLGLGTAGIAAAENVGDNLAKGRTSAQDMQQAVEGAAVEGGAVIAVGKATELISSALGNVSAKVAEKAAAKEPVKPLPDKALKRVAGGAKDPGWKPTGGAAKAASKVWDYAEDFEVELRNFNPGYEIRTNIEHDMYLVQYHSEKPIGKHRSLKYWTTTDEANGISTVTGYMDRMALLKDWGPRNHVTVARIPAGTKVKYAIGTAAKQPKLPEVRPGGGLQLMFEYFDENWIIQTAKLP